MILADTSAWVEYDRATGSPVDRRMAQLIVDNRELAVTEPVVMEVLAGARTDACEQDLRRLLERFELLAVEPVADFEAAARLYRRCRRAGVSPRGLVVCLIAAIAWRTGASILAADADLDRVAAVAGIALDASASASACAAGA